MSVISEEEFNVIVEQLMDESDVKFNMLCSIADKTLRPTVAHRCTNDPSLYGKQLEDDIMQEIHIRLIKTCKSSFFITKRC